MSPGPFQGHHFLHHYHFAVDTTRPMTQHLSGEKTMTISATVYQNMATTDNSQWTAAQQSSPSMSSGPFQGQHFLHHYHFDEDTARAMAQQLSGEIIMTISTTIYQCSATTDHSSSHHLQCHQALFRATTSSITTTLMRTQPDQ